MNVIIWILVIILVIVIATIIINSKKTYYGGAKETNLSKSFRERIITGDDTTFLKLIKSPWLNLIAVYGEDSFINEAVMAGKQNYIHALLNTDAINTIEHRSAKYKGRTAVLLAAQNLNPQIFYTLLRYGADIYALDDDSKGVVQIAIENSNDTFKSSSKLLAILKIYDFYSWHKRVPPKKVQPTVLRKSIVNIPGIIASDNYTEQQESAACGRHALNNLFGGRYFIKDSGVNVNTNPNN